MVLSDYVFDGAASKGLINLNDGLFHFTSNGKPDQGVTLKTRAATIGVRGTEFLVHVDGDDATVIDILSGAVGQSRTEPASRSCASAARASWWRAQTRMHSAAISGPSPRLPARLTATVGRNRAIPARIGATRRRPTTSRSRRPPIPTTEAARAKARSCSICAGSPAPNLGAGRGGGSKR